MTSAPTMRGIQPADTDVRLDESLFVDAMLSIQDAVQLPREPMDAWCFLLSTAYDLCFAHLHDLRTDRSTSTPGPVAACFLEAIFGNEQGSKFDEHSLAIMHELVLERTPAFDERTGRLVAPRGSRDQRRAQGAFYTPDSIIDGLLDRALDPLLDRAEASPDPLYSLLAIRVCDPACGTGHFLVKAGERIAARAAQHANARDAQRVRVHVLRESLFGAELDPVSAHVCRRRLWSIAGDGELPPSLHEQRILCGHGLLGAPAGQRSSVDADTWCRAHLGDEGLAAMKPVHWHFVMENGFDLVIGNPPFLNQLGRKTRLQRAAAALLRDRFGDSVKGYADPAAIFLRMAIDIVKPGGRVSLVQPQSVLAARDTRGIRSDLAREACLVHIWLDCERVFDAAVHVCAPVLERSQQRTTRMGRSCGAAFKEAAGLEIDMDALSREATWSPLVCDLVGIPRVTLPEMERVGEIAEATADFRDQYYGLRDIVTEAPQEGPDPGHAPLVTTGLIDPATCHWGQRTTRYDRRRWSRPQVNLEALVQETKLGSWADARLVPKILLATQTRVLEVYVDEIGELLPMTPLLTIIPHDPDRLWHLAAALASPVTTAVAAGRYLGTARATNAIKLGAKQVLELPLPREGTDWDGAAEAFLNASMATDAARDQHLLESARLACAASGLPDARQDALMEWWMHRSETSSNPT